MRKALIRAVANVIPPLKRIRLQRDLLLASRDLLLASNERLLADRAVSRLISTLPRSGTWYTKYLLTFIYRLSAGLEIEIKDVFPHVIALTHGAIGVDQISDLRRKGLLSDLPFVEISHYICPGFLSLDDDTARAARQTLERIGALAWHIKAEGMLRACAPENGGHVCFLYRNPFSVFLSYARLFTDRDEIVNKKEVPFNPHIPIAVDFQNQPYDDPFSHYVSNFRNSNFIEIFMVMAASFVHMERLFPNNVRIVRYDEIRQNEYECAKQILGFLGFPVDEDRFNSVLEQSIQLVKKEKMSEYEQILGHSLYGAKNNYGVEVRNHISRTPERRWQNVFTEGDVEWARERVEMFYPGLQHMLD